MGRGGQLIFYIWASVIVIALTITILRRLIFVAAALVFFKFWFVYAANNLRKEGNKNKTVCAWAF